MSFEINLNKKVAIVTAATKGIGLDAALVLAKAGAKVYIAARNENAFNEIKQKYSNFDLNYVYFDPTNIDSLNSFVDKVYEKEKRIDILVNNFGITNLQKDRNILQTTYDDFEYTLNINVKSVFISIQSAAKYMMQNNYGSIINISSIGSITPDITRIGYSVSKSTVNALTQNIAAQLAQFNIRCNAILPGLINTEAATKNLDQKFLDIFLSNTPLNRIGTVSDISNMILFLASDLSTYITGEIISIAGGFNKFTPLYSVFNSKK